MKKITLRKEVEAVDLYLRREQVRFDDRLKIELQISDQAHTALVPIMILQPLIENAVKHAIAENETGGRIAVAARVEGGASDDDMLCLSVAENGPGLPRAGAALPHGGRSEGLNNSRERIQVLYGDAQTFNVTNVHPHGLEVEICIPLERSSQ